MRKTTLIVILLMGCLQASFAQTTTPDASMPGKKEKMTDQFIGVQINGLIRQVFNFNNSAPGTANVSPYQLNYSINMRKTGWGLRVGLGYNYNSNYTNDGITETTTKINNIHARFGIEKAFRLSDKWSAGAGIDFVYHNDDDDTKTTVRSFDTVTTDTKDVAPRVGGGVMGWLRYNLTEHIVLGTEASYYYTTGTQKQTIDITTSPNVGGGGGGGITTTETTSNPTISQGAFSSPVSLYIIVRF